MSALNRLRRRHGSHAIGNPDALPRRTATPMPRAPRPAVPAPAGLLRQVADGLRNLPSAHLRDVIRGQDATHEPLRGQPSFAGTGRANDGPLAAGIWLGDEDGTGQFVIDCFDPDWFRALADAAVEAADALEAAREAAA